MTQHNSHPDDLLLDDLVTQALEAERFEAMIGTQLPSMRTSEFASSADEASPAAPLLRLAGHASARALPARSNSWMRVGSLAAAAALAVTTFVVFRNASPTPSPLPREVAGGGAKPVDPQREAEKAGRSNAAEGGQAIEVTQSRGEVRSVAYSGLSSQDLGDKLADFAHLDPELVDGLPTLNGERSLIVAVYRGIEPSTQDCDCLTWSVKDANSASKPDILADALHTPCGAASQGVTLVSITGPRSMLPFHDDEARELVQCIADVATSEQDQDPCIVDDLCQASLAALCLPEELSVETLSVRLGTR